MASLTPKMPAVRQNFCVIERFDRQPWQSWTAQWRVGRGLRVVEVIGWTSSLILLLTLIRQVHTQWRTGATAGVSKWLFLGQSAASVGYIIYSFLLHNWVYVSSNIAILATAFIGEAIYLRNRKRQAERKDGSSVSASSPA